MAVSSLSAGNDFHIYAKAITVGTLSVQDASFIDVVATDIQVDADLDVDGTTALHGNLVVQGATTVGSITASTVSATNVVFDPPLATVDTAVKSVVVSGASAAFKDESETATNPLWTWLTPGPPAPAQVDLSAMRSGNYVHCALKASDVILPFPGGPWQASFSLPYAPAAPFPNVVDKLIGAVSAYSAPTSVVTCDITSLTGTILGTVFIDNTAIQTVDLSASFIYKLT